jgi:hypothetical protein
VGEAPDPVRFLNHAALTGKFYLAAPRRTRRRGATRAEATPVLKWVRPNRQQHHLQMHLHTGASGQLVVGW